MNQSSSSTNTLNVKVVPGASSNAISGWLGEKLKIRVSTPPEKGKANALVIELLSKKLGIPAKSITIISGKKSPHKTLEIQGLPLQVIKEMLSQ